HPAQRQNGDREQDQEDGGDGHCAREETRHGRALSHARRAPPEVRIGALKIQVSLWRPVFDVHIGLLGFSLRVGDPDGFLPPPSLLRAPVSLGGHRRSCVSVSIGQPMEITWYGRACFRLRGRDATVIVDPCPPATGFVAGKHDVDLLTISHEHPDHTYTRSITARLTLTRPGEYEFRDLLVIGI